MPAPPAGKSPAFAPGGQESPGTSCRLPATIAGCCAARAPLSRGVSLARLLLGRRHTQECRMPPIVPPAQAPPGPAAIAATPKAAMAADGFARMIGRLAESSAPTAPANPAGNIPPAAPDPAASDPTASDPTGAIPPAAPAAVQCPTLPAAQGKGQPADKDREPDRTADTDAPSALPIASPVPMPPPACVPPIMPVPPPVTVAGTAGPTAAPGVTPPAAPPPAAPPLAAAAPTGEAAPPTRASLPPATPADIAPAPGHREAPATGKPADPRPAPDDAPPNPATPSLATPSLATPNPAAPSPATVPAATPMPHPQAPVTASAPLAASHQAAPPAVPAAQAAAAVGVLLRPGETAHQLTLRFDPAELGHVRIAITRPHDAPPSVALTVERPETLLLLLRDQPALHRALDQAGVPADGRSISFHLAMPTHDAGAHADPGASQTAPQMGGWQSGGWQSSGWQQGQQAQAGPQDQRRPAFPADSGQPLPGTAAFPPPPARRVWRRAGIDITA
jgi:hypothetical protein